MDICELAIQLSKLKKSSNEAVDDEDDFDEFKQYMHVVRPVEKRLKEIIKIVYKEESKKLILLCGNAGDGKSNLLSTLKYELPEMMAIFNIHNDATASKLPNEQPEETLAKFLEDFNDEHLKDHSDNKVILAINLGTLSKFLESEDGQNFGALKEYVFENNILSEEMEAGEKKTFSGIFSYVSFCDYHLYTLENGMANSEFILSLLEKIFFEEKNIFSDAYQKCKQCEMQSFCPIKNNFEIMREEKIRTNIVSIIVEAVIKSKIILSTRALLNMIYAILIHPSFSFEKLKKMKDLELVKISFEWSLPFLLFESNSPEPILNAIGKYDLLKVTSPQKDELALQFNILKDIEGIFKKHFGGSLFLNNINHFKINDVISNLEISSHKKSKEFRSILYKYFIRMYKICGLNSLMEIYDQSYRDFVKYLYFTESGEISGLENLYNLVLKVIYLWNGSKEENMLNINIANQNYTLIEIVEVVEDVSFIIIKDSKKLEEFKTDLRVRVKNKNGSQIADLDIDYDLFCLMIDIKNGYKVSLKDHSDFIRFSAFIHKIESFGDIQQELLVRNNINNKLYKLEKSSFGIVLKEV